MRKYLLLYLLFLLLLASCINGLSGGVVAVSNGDTFTLLTDGNKQHKVRLHGVDCPEKNQAYGQKVKDFTSDLIFGKDVVVEITDTDKYGRIVGITYVDGKVLNEELLSAGYAWHYKQYSDSEWYALLEAKARVERQGLWADTRPIPPWDFRKSKATSASKSKSASVAYVLVCSNGKSYHTPTCSIVARCSDTKRYSEKDAKAKGLKPCKRCF
ncbi:MAG: thermonuclease family protein [Prevotellaceae bacterium]|jgi:endonuclease YncB( thermonuclease family)|nr:thermonuclease family protein [Prevotellaceae bacterium]